jgi:hypothetical protein
VEELIGKAQILLGEKIIKQNLQNEIAVNPIKMMLYQQAKVTTLMVDGG